MVHYESLIDGTSFGIVRNTVESNGSAIREILFVTCESLLPEVARLLDGESFRGPDARRVQWDYLLRSGQVLPEVRTHGFGIDTADISNEAYCRVILFPPVYLVHLPRLQPRTVPAPAP